MNSEKTKRESEENEDPEISFTIAKDLLINAAVKRQQEFYEQLSDWNSFENDPIILKNLIGTIIYGPPKAGDQTSWIMETDSSTSGNEEGNIDSIRTDLSYNSNLFRFEPPSRMKNIDNIYKKIVKYGTEKSKEKKILFGLVYNVIFTKNSIRALTNEIEEAQNFNSERLLDFVCPVPLFKVLKFIGSKDPSKLAECVEIYYIDNNARVYKNWSDYLSSNNLPSPCVMVLPYNGEYQSDQSTQWTEDISYVRLECHETTGSKEKHLKALDITSTVLGLGSLVVAFANPATPIIAAGGLIGMGVSALWSGGRSCHELIDRSKHDQSINLTNKEGFTCWLGVTSNALAITSAGGTTLLSRAIRNGTTVNRWCQVAHDTVQLSTIISTGMNTCLSLYNVFDNYKESQEIRTQDILNALASIIIFGNAVVSFKTTKTIIESHQTSIIKDYEASLRSNRHRKEFQKMIRNTKSVLSDPTKINEHIIRGINKIENKDEFFSHMLRNKKNFAAEGIKPSFVEGHYFVDGKRLISVTDFVESFKNVNLSGKSTTNLNVNSTVPVAVSATIESKFDPALVLFISRYSYKLKDYLIPKLWEFGSLLTGINEYDQPDIIFLKLLNISFKIVSMIMQKEYPVTNLIVNAVDFLWKYAKTSMKEQVSRMMIQIEKDREFLMKVIIYLHEEVERNLEQWIKSFKEYLKIKLRRIEDDVRDVVEKVVSGGLDRDRYSELSQDTKLDSISDRNQTVISGIVSENWNSKLRYYSRLQPD